MKLRIITLIIAMTTSLSAQASADSFRLVKDFWGKVAKYSPAENSEQRNQYIQQFFSEHYDFDYFFKLTLNDHWDTWTEEQKNDFSLRLKRLLLDRLTDQIGKLYKSKFVNGTSEIQGVNGIQRFVVYKDDTQFNFKIYLIKRETEWKIDDLEINDVLLSRNYAAQFNRILRRDGYTGLIAQLDKKIATMKPN